jgi:redox-sensitive bicupin YhaK (pirin superfamily)
MIEPDCSSCPDTPEIATLIDARVRNVDGLAVRRLLPSVAKRLVGPFAFFDHLGPDLLAPGAGLDVRPHPHIGLATVTYLFEGAIQHRDSLGKVQVIQPGEINWMTAGRGIVHSERTPAELRREGSRIHALQLWIALPLEHEEAEPGFHHHEAQGLPSVERDGVRIRVLLGSAYGVSSPVATFSPTFYVDVALPAGAALSVPVEHEERAVYVVEGAIACGTQEARTGRMLVLTPGADVTLRASSDARFVLLGGAALEGPRHIFWNFVSSSRERIEEAKRSWKERRFPSVPGDDVEFIPLPE